jgi:hypothetical protein
MALSTIAITQGTGTPVTVDTSAGGDMQVVKLAESVLGSNALIPASAATGLLVNVGTPAVTQSGAWNVGVVTSITNAVTVAGTVAISGTPAVAQSGTWTVAISGTATVAGTVAISGTAAVTQSGVWNVGTVTTITNTVTVAGTVAISGTPTIQGTVTGNQGTAAAVAAAWPIKLTDATNTSALQNVGGIYALPVKVLAQTGGGYSQVDKTAYTEGTFAVEVIGGVYNDAFAGSPAAGQASVLRITAQRGAHVNLRRNDGTEIGTSTTPLVIVGNTGGNVPVQGTVTANQGTPTNWAFNVVQIGGAAVVTAAAGVQQVGIVSGAGVPFSAAAPLPVAVAPSTGFWKAAVTYAASQTDQSIHTPAGGKTAYVEGIIITVTAVGVLKVYDQTNAAAGMIFQGSPILGTVVITPHRPIPLSAVNNILRYSTGTAATGDITAWGYEV